MKDGVGKEEVSEGSLWRDGQELSFVLWVDLDTKTHYKKERHEDLVRVLHTLHL